MSVFDLVKSGGYNPVAYTSMTVSLGGTRATYSVFVKPVDRDTGVAVVRTLSSDLPGVSREAVFLSQVVINVERDADTLPASTLDEIKRKYSKHKVGGQLVNSTRLAIRRNLIGFELARCVVLDVDELALAKARYAGPGYNDPNYHIQDALRSSDTYSRMYHALNDGWDLTFILPHSL